jgi:hypothetical protein
MDRNNNLAWMSLFVEHVMAALDVIDDVPSPLQNRNHDFPVDPRLSAHAGSG